MATASSRLEAVPEEDGAGQVFLEPHLPLQAALLPAPSAACPSRELETSQPKLPVTETKLQPCPSSLSQSRKCLDPQEPVTSSQMSLWMNMLETRRCLSSLALQFSLPCAVDIATTLGFNYKRQSMKDALQPHSQS